MKFENSFVGSFDPFHSGHLQTWMNAEEKFGPTQIVICRNNMKNQGWLDLEQRRQDIMYTLLLNEKFDAKKRDPEEIVKIAHNLEDIANIFHRSERAIRGIRGPEDIEYNELLMKKTGLEHIAKQKGHYIQVPQSHTDISSTTNKIVLQKFLTHYTDVPSVYRKVFGENVYQRLKNEKFSYKSRDIPQTTWDKIQNNIVAYFEKLEKM